jgi:hypothetical protein
MNTNSIYEVILILKICTDIWIVVFKFFFSFHRVQTKYSYEYTKILGHFCDVAPTVYRELLDQQFLLHDEFPYRVLVNDKRNIKPPY